jgi:hypothetical protein
MRMSKIKSSVALRKAAQHNTRERPPRNADTDRTDQNITDGRSATDIMDCYEFLRPEKIRKNAVHAIEVFMSASPEFSGDWDKYLLRCSNWVQKTFGSKNILSIDWHKDETTPHVHILVIPLKDGKLNARTFIGGKRDRMVELQDDFFAYCGVPFGLERGQSREETRARHNAHTLKFAAQELKAQKERLDARAAAVEKKSQGVDESFRVLEDTKAKTGEHWKCPRAKQGESAEAFYARIEREYNLGKMAQQLPAHRHRPDVDHRGR